MSVRVRPYRKRGVFHPGKWEVAMVVRRPNGGEIKKRFLIPVQGGAKKPSKAVLEWVEQHQACLMNGDVEPAKAEPSVPTLTEFAPQFIENYAKARKQKPSGVDSKQRIIDFHLVPVLGQKRLDKITDSDVGTLMSRMRGRSGKTVNNVLCVLSKLLKVAVKWKVISSMPVAIERVGEEDSREVEFYEFEQYEALVEAAERIDRRTLVMVLLGGDAGLRTGEMIALEQSDVDFRRNLLTIKESEWKGHVSSTKGNKVRTVPLTERLRDALQRNRHLKSDRVLLRDDGTTVSQETLRGWLKVAQRRANLKANGAKHVLRHTFCSHLAMNGASVTDIQRLAGHRQLSTTMQYMHLSPSHMSQAINLLSQGRSARVAQAAEEARLVLVHGANLEPASDRAESSM